MMITSFRVDGGEHEHQGMGALGGYSVAAVKKRIGWVRSIGDPVLAQLSAARATSVCAKLRIVETSAYMVKALDESTWPAFAALVEFNNGIFGGCWCMGFHAEGVGKGTTPAVNRERKLSRVRAATAHAALVFDGDDCLGWCQFGVPGELPRIKSRAAYEQARTTSPDWRIACCYVGKGHRRQGVATAALAGALDLIAGQGGAGSRDIRRRPNRCPLASSTTGHSRPTRIWGSRGIARSASIVGSSRWPSSPRRSRWTILCQDVEGHSPIGGFGREHSRQDWRPTDVSVHAQSQIGGRGKV
jgi:hypothetical protein